VLNRSWTLALLAGAVLAITACEEHLVGGNACPQLCPEQQLGYQDTVFTAAQVIDTILTLPGIPSIGTENQVLVARYAQTGDSVVSVAVFRFDTLPRFFLQTDTTKPDIPFTSVDSSSLFITALDPPTGQDTFYVQDTVTFVVYDVTVNAPNLDTAPVHAKFSGVPVGSRTLPRDSVKGVIEIPIDTAFLTARVTGGKPVWLGVSVVSKKNAQVAFAASGGLLATGVPGNLGYNGISDTTKIYQRVPVNAFSTAFGPAMPAMADYQMIFKGGPPVPPGMLAVGGLPSNRVLVKFKFPAWLIDSSTTVVRANLELQQAAFTAFRVDSDSVFMVPLVVIAGPEVTDLQKLGIVVGDAAITPFLNGRTYKLPPAGIGLDTVPMVRTLGNVFNFWRVQGAKTQRGIVFQLVGEGAEPRELLFYGTSAAPALRPRVHVSYVPHARIGLP
jgi:hypothetical protein